jgi:hypothetical protein
MMEPRADANGTSDSSPCNKVGNGAIGFPDEVHCNRRLALTYPLANSEVLFWESTV